MKRFGFAVRLLALTRKETRQMLRDRSNLLVGLLLPVVLLLLFGYGLSFDVKDARVSVVMEDDSPTARDAVSGLQGSEYLEPTFGYGSLEAERRMRAGLSDAILIVPPDFSRRLAQGDAQLQLLLNGVDSTTASTIEGYVNGAIALPQQRRVERAGGKPLGIGSVAVVSRMWFNEANDSTWYLVPGLVVLVMTLIGAFLTSLLVAREWERGTLESLFVTPVRPLELVLSKLLPYLLIGAIDLAVCLIMAKWLFHVPMHGSLAVTIGSSLLYLMVSLSLGLFISAVTRNQFTASQVALLVSFMPAMMLSGFVFDLRNVPLVIQIVSQVLPATHFMGLIKTLFLAGDNTADAIRACSVLSLFVVVLLIGTTRALRKKLG
ncbi:MAG TPA: ABC transporter permease [Polyangiaceae bacterium]|nr:ABC transporter permease [Polyangiaceae bacterium]